MTTALFKIGDKVKAIKYHCSEKPTGVGEVVRITTGMFTILFKTWTGGHCGGNSTFNQEYPRNHWEYNPIDAKRCLQLINKPITNWKKEMEKLK